ncbi:unnamed protein product, partial [Meganyctiphanes norvegica]
EALANGEQTATAEEPAASDGKSIRLQFCDKCRNHELIIRKRGHKGKCKYEHCVCEKCTLTLERRMLFKHQQRLWRKPESQEEDEDQPDAVNPLLQTIGQLHMNKQQDRIPHSFEDVVTTTASHITGTSNIPSTSYNQPYLPELPPSPTLLSLPQDTMPITTSSMVFPAADPPLMFQNEQNGSDSSMGVGPYISYEIGQDHKNEHIDSRATASSSIPTTLPYPYDYNKELSAWHHSHIGLRTSGNYSPIGQFRNSKYFYNDITTENLKEDHHHSSKNQSYLNLVSQKPLYDENNVQNYSNSLHNPLNSSYRSMVILHSTSQRAASPMSSTPPINPLLRNSDENGSHSPTIGLPSQITKTEAYSKPENNYNQTTFRALIDSSPSNATSSPDLSFNLHNTDSSSSQSSGMYSYASYPNLSTTQSNSSAQPYLRSHHSSKYRYSPLAHNNGPNDRVPASSNNAYANLRIQRDFIDFTNQKYQTHEILPPLRGLDDRLEDDLNQTAQASLFPVRREPIPSQRSVHPEQNLNDQPEDDLNQSAEASMFPVRRNPIPSQRSNTPYDDTNRYGAINLTRRS